MNSFKFFNILIILLASSYFLGYGMSLTSKNSIQNIPIAEWIVYFPVDVTPEQRSEIASTLGLFDKGPINLNDGLPMKLKLNIDSKIEESEFEIHHFVPNKEYETTMENRLSFTMNLYGVDNLDFNINSEKTPEYFVNVENGLNSMLRTSKSLNTRNDNPILKWNQDSLSEYSLMAQPTICQYFPSLNFCEASQGETVSDPLFTQQWHLRNIGQYVGQTPGEDANIVPAWEVATGLGVRIQIIDDGVDYTHEDLVDAYVAEDSNNYNGAGVDPMPDGGSSGHGTSCSGVALGRTNSVCGVGVARDSSLAAIKLINGAISDADQAAALTYHLSTIDISSNSWGAAPTGGIHKIQDSVISTALENGVTNGRNGNGIIYTFAAGNARLNGINGQYDQRVSNINTIAIGASTDSGTHSSYSCECACLLINAPSNGGVSGIVTNTLPDSADTGVGIGCTNTFGGTSSATPLVSGVIAMMLQIKPELTWIEVQNLLVVTAEKNDPTHGGWTTNNAGISHHYGNGFGRVNADHLMQILPTYPQHGIRASYSGTDTPGAPIPIPDDGTLVTRTITLSGTAGYVIDHVQVRITTSSTQNRGDLQVVLRCPEVDGSVGTLSILLESRTIDQVATNYNDFEMDTVRCWGEPSQQNVDFELILSDLQPNGETSSLDSWTVTVWETEDVGQLNVAAYDGGLLSSCPFMTAKVSNRHLSVLRGFRDSSLPTFITNFYYDTIVPLTNNRVTSSPFAQLIVKYVASYLVFLIENKSFVYFSLVITTSVVVLLVKRNYYKY